MAEFPSVTVDLSEQLEFPGDSYPLTGKVDVATYTVGEKEYQLQDGIDYDVHWAAGLKEEFTARWLALCGEERA